MKRITKQVVYVLRINRHIHVFHLYSHVDSKCGYGEVTLASTEIYGEKLTRKITKTQTLP